MASIDYKKELDSTQQKKTATPLIREELKFSDKIIFSITVSITGAAVMMIELLGTRIIGPFYGVSLIVWSALISVTLMALAVGYYTGGKLADRCSKIQLSYIILAAAFFTGIIPVISSPVQLATEVMGLQLGALSSALILFTIPLALLGMTGPYIIKIAANGLDGIGAIAGNVYAVSTIGSVIGTLFLGFYLLPIAGTRNIIIAVGLVLVVLSLCFSIYETRRLGRTKAPIITFVSCITIAGFIIAAGVISANKQYKNYEVVSEAESHYGWVRVVDQPNEKIRWLLSDSSSIGVEDLETGESLLGYQTIIKHLPRFNPLGSDALLIGLGSGHLDKSLRRHQVITDSIEIDPAVADAAIRHFNFKPSGKLIVGDARYQINQLQKKYDFIIHDCFTGGSEPIHLLSLEMLTEIKSHLRNKQGILVLNFVGYSRGNNKQALAAVAKTLDQLFDYKRVFVSEPGDNFNDFVFFSSDKPLQLSAARADQKLAKWLRMREVLVKSDDGFIITDNYNPLESLQLAKAEHYRNILVERMGKNILLW